MNRKLGPNWGYPQFQVIFAQKLSWGWVGGCKFSKIVVKVGVGVAKLKKIVWLFDEIKLEHGAENKNIIRPFFSI